MSGDIPDELHILAGEYVLGVLDEGEMRAVRRQARTDPALASAIAAWERRLSPLANAVPPQAPPPALWDRLARAIAEVPASTEAPTPPRRPADVVPLVPREPRQPAEPPRRTVWPWQLTSVASLAIAATVAAIAFVPGLALRLNLPPQFMPQGPAASPAQRFAALMPLDSRPPGPVTSGPVTSGGFIAQARADGSVVLTAFAPVTVPGGRDLELWILRPGQKAPASLGVLPAGGKRVTLPAVPPEGTQLLISLEPPGGSTTGQPTGPVLYGGALTQIAL